MGIKFLLGYARNAREFGRNEARGYATGYGVTDARYDDVSEIVDHFDGRIDRNEARAWWNRIRDIGYYGEVRV